MGPTCTFRRRWHRPGVAGGGDGGGDQVARGRDGGGPDHLRQFVSDGAIRHADFTV
jgi:hypothetical protein